MSTDPPSRAELYRIIERLVAENTALRTEVARLTARGEELAAELAVLRAGGAAAGRGRVPDRAPRGERPKQPRAKRTAQFARPRGLASVRVEHALDACPDCGGTLRGGSVKRHREVIEVALPPAVVTDHVLLERLCPHCNRRCVPTLTAADGVVGQHRFGPTLLTLITTLHELGRMPVRLIHEQLATIFGVRVSLGAIAAALRAVASRGATQVAAIRDTVRISPVVHADETVWWQDGQGRTLWVTSTPTARYFEIGRRTAAQIDGILGADFAGLLVSDFYAAYHHLGTHQRCWAHILRELRELVAAHPADPTLARWTQRLSRIYHAARDAPGTTAPTRRAIRSRLERRVRDLCQPHVAAAVPQRKLSARLIKHLHELFSFVTEPGVPSTNNQAERDLRPLVIARKIWGGTRSEQGSIDAARRFTLFRTWRAQGLNPFAECRKLLLSPQF